MYTITLSKGNPMSQRPIFDIQSTHTIAGVTIGNDIESAERIRNATNAIFNIIDNQGLNDWEISVVKKLVWPTGDKNG